MTWMTRDPAEHAVSPSLDSYPDEAVELGRLIVTGTRNRSRARSLAKAGDVAPVLGGTMPPTLSGGPADRCCGQDAAIEKARSVPGCQAGERADKGGNLFAAEPDVAQLFVGESLELTAGTPDIPGVANVIEKA